MRRLWLPRRAASFMLAWVLAGAVGEGLAQQASARHDVPTMRFDVASVRQSPEASSYRVAGGFAPHSTTLRLENFDLQNLLAMAYGVRPDQIVGLPEWGAMFNVEAKGDVAADERMQSLTGEQQAMEQQHMLQDLLAERFALRTRWEAREGPALRLAVAKGGPRLQTGAGVSEEETKAFAGESVPALYQRNGRAGGYEFVGHGCTMNELAEVLSGQFGVPVTDSTGLTGKYDFVVRYKGARTSDRNADDLNPVPALDAALGDQLGLKLEKTRGAQRVLVVEHVEKPSAN